MCGVRLGIGRERLRVDGVGIGKDRWYGKRLEGGNTRGGGFRQIVEVRKLMVGSGVRQCRLGIKV